MERSKDPKYQNRLRQKLMFYRSMTRVTKRINKMKVLVSNFKDLRFRDVNDYILQCEPLYPLRDKAQLGYTPTLTFITMNRDKVVPTLKFIKGFMEAAKAKKKKYCGYPFEE